MIPWDEKTVSQSLWDREVGAYVLNCLQHCDTSVLAQQVDSEAVRLLEEIKAIIQDPALDDPECFARIEALTNAFYLRDKRAKWSFPRLRKPPSYGRMIGKNAGGRELCAI